MLEVASRETLKRLIIVLLFVFSLLPTIFHMDFGCTINGYSVWWLIILYIVGGYVKKYGITYRKNWLFIYGLSVGIMWVSKIVIEIIQKKFYGAPQDGTYLISYTSPFVVVCAVALLLHFEKKQCGKKLIIFINFFAPVTFGAYLVHEEPLIREAFISGAFAKYLSYAPIQMVGAVIGTAFMIWLIGSLVDRIRLLIFDILKVRKLCNVIDTAIENKMQQVLGEVK